MDELKIKTPIMKKIIGKAISRYLKKKGIDLDIVLNDIDGKTTEDGYLKLHIDGDLILTQGQIINLIGGDL